MWQSCLGLVVNGFLGVSIFSNDMNGDYQDSEAASHQIDIHGEEAYPGDLNGGPTASHMLASVKK